MINNKTIKSRLWTITYNVLGIKSTHKIVNNSIIHALNTSNQYLSGNINDSYKKEASEGGFLQSITVEDVWVSKNVFDVDK